MAADVTKVCPLCDGFVIGSANTALHRRCHEGPVEFGPVGPPTVQEKTMHTDTLSFAPAAPFIGIPVAQAAPRSRTGKALLSLMDMYEQGEGTEDYGDSETELMVMLSGMVGVDTRLLAGE
jgi:hypothetical protein